MHENLLYESLLTQNFQIYGTVCHSGEFISLPNFLAEQYYLVDLQRSLNWFFITDDASFVYFWQGKLDFLSYPERLCVADLQPSMINAVLMAQCLKVRKREQTIEEEEPVVHDLFQIEVQDNTG